MADCFRTGPIVRASFSAPWRLWHDLRSLFGQFCAGSAVYCKSLPWEGSRSSRFPARGTRLKALTTPPWSSALPEADIIAAMFSLVPSDAEAETDVGRNFALAQAQRMRLKPFSCLRQYAYKPKCVPVQAPTAVTASLIMRYQISG